MDEKERLLYFAKFNVDGLLRGDYKSRMEGYAIGRQNGWLSINDIRRLEDMPSIAKEQGGDDYLVNGNMTAAGVATQQVQKGGSDGEGKEGDANAPDERTPNKRKRRVGGD